MKACRLVICSLHLALSLPEVLFGFPSGCLGAGEAAEGRALGSLGKGLSQAGPKAIRDSSVSASLPKESHCHLLPI